MYPPQYQDFLDNNLEYLHDMRARLLMPDLIALPEQFAQLVGLVTELSASFHYFAADTNRRLTSLETSVAFLTSSDLENRARHNILNIAMDELALTRGRILLATGRDTDPGFLNMINAAEEVGLITEQQVDNVLVAGIIIRARRADDKQYVHAVFTVSRTIRLDDITRVHDRAATMAAAANEETIAAGIGEVMQPQQQAEPDATGKAMMTRLQSEHPDRFTEAPLRTIQRRMKEWHGIMAKKLVYAGTDESLAASNGLSELALIGVDPRC